MSIIKAPFTPEQVETLNEWQSSNSVHPFICSGPGEIFGCYGNCKLSATREGFICPCEKYTQDWAHDFMANPRKLVKKLNAKAKQ